MKYRHECKFFLSAQTAAVLKGRVTAVMRPDTHSGGVYVVNNLYLDDQYDSFYYGKHLGRYARDKYRIRFYNGDLSYIRLERKHKDGALSYKESVPLTAEQYLAASAGDLGPMLSDSGCKLIETLGVLHRLRRMRPASEYSYTREAYIYGPGNVRITFDSRIGDDVAGYPGREGSPPGPGGMMEVKYDLFLPDVITGLFAGLPLARTDMSKYCYVRDKEAWQHAKQAGGNFSKYAASTKS